MNFINLLKCFFLNFIHDILHWIVGLSIKGRGKKFKSPLIFKRKLFCYQKLEKAFRKNPANCFFLSCLFVCWLVVVFLVFLCLSYIESTRLTEDGRKWFVVGQNFLLTDSKLQRLVNVNIKIRKYHPKMFCTYSGTKKITFSRRAAGYHVKQQKIQEWSQEWQCFILCFLFFTRKTVIWFQYTDYNVLQR